MWPTFVEVPAPTDEALQAPLHKIIARLMTLLIRRGVQVEEEGATYLADSDGDTARQHHHHVGFRHDQRGDQKVG